MNKGECFAAHFLPSVLLLGGQRVHLSPDMRLEFRQDNPKKIGSMAYENYEGYKGAQTVREFAVLQGPGNLGRTKAQAVKDIAFDLSRGFATLPGSTTAGPFTEAPVAALGAADAPAIAAAPAAPLASAAEDVAPADPSLAMASPPVDQNTASVIAPAVPIAPVAAACAALAVAPPTEAAEVAVAAGGCRGAAEGATPEAIAGAATRPATASAVRVAAEAATAAAIVATTAAAAPPAQKQCPAAQRRRTGVGTGVAVAPRSAKRARRTGVGPAAVPFAVESHSLSATDQQHACIRRRSAAEAMPAKVRTPGQRPVGQRKSTRSTELTRGKRPVRQRKSTVQPPQGASKPQPPTVPRSSWGRLKWGAQLRRVRHALKRRCSAPSSCAPAAAPSDTAWPPRAAAPSAAPWVVARLPSLAPTSSPGVAPSAAPLPAPNPAPSATALEARPLGLAPSLQAVAPSVAPRLAQSVAAGPEEAAPKRLRLLCRTSDEPSEADRDAEDILAAVFLAAGTQQPGADIGSSASGLRQLAGDAPSATAADPSSHPLMRAWEEKMKEMIAQGTGHEDYVAIQVMERARRGLPWGKGLPVLNVQEAECLLLRCGYKNALNHDRERRAVVQALAKTAEEKASAPRKESSAQVEALRPARRALGRRASPPAAGSPPGAVPLGVAGPLSISLTGDDDEVPVSELLRRQRVVV